MQVRGAPAIAIVASLSVAIELVEQRFSSTDELIQFVDRAFEKLQTARKTAVNVYNAAETVRSYLSSLQENDVTGTTEKLLTFLEKMLTDDVADNKAIGDFGAKWITDNASKEKVEVLTHCNTGSLATAGYGTALGIIRSLHHNGKLNSVYCTETRPYNQGARLTAYELVYENIPSTLICDSMAAVLMKERCIDAIIVGADRVAANGDTANKIGTYQLAIAAKHHGVAFIVAAPVTSIDFSCPSGDHIKVEERPTEEMLCFHGERVAAEGIGCWNPAFDVTPADLISVIVTDRGAFKPAELHKLQ